MAPQNARRKSVNRSGETGQQSNKPGVPLLISNMTKIGFDSIPKVTFFMILGQVILFQRYIKVPWDKNDVCLSVNTLLNDKDFKRFIISPFEHADKRHLYYNMMSFLIKGRTLENQYGSLNFALLLTFMLLLTNSFYIGLALLGVQFMEDDSLLDSCKIGFSGVVFALKVITTVETGDGTAYVMGYEVPSKYGVWVELMIVHQFVPSASALSHLAGTLAGCSYISTPLGRVVDYIIATISGSLPQDLPYNKANNPETRKKTERLRRQSNPKNK